MTRSLLVIGASVAAALVVLGLTLWLGQGTTPAGGDGSRGGSGAGPVDMPEVESVPAFDPDRVIDPDLVAQSQVFEGVDEGYTIVEGNRRVIMTWDRLDPRPQGAYDVVGPRTWVFFDAAQVLCIEAERGMLVAPENEPQEGDLVGNVTLTFYRATDGEPVDLDTMRDAEVRAHLDRASFNLVLGHVESDSAVRVVGRRVSFRGRGLSLTYNERRKRIDRLEVFEGESLRFKPGKEAGKEAEENRRAGEQESRRTEEQADASAGAARGEGDVEDTVPASASPTESDAGMSAQFYRAELKDAVRVNVGQGDRQQMEMTGEALAAVFSLGGGEDEQELETEAETDAPVDAPPSAEPSASTDATADAAVDAPATLSTPSPGPRPAGDAALADESGEHTPVDDAPTAPGLFTLGPEDVLVTWTGPLLLLPLDEAPADFADADDVSLALTGSPAMVRTDSDETIQGRTIDYLASAGRLRAHGEEDQAVQLASPELGMLTGRGLVINQSAGTGSVTGPGTLRAAVEDDALPSDSDDDMSRDLRIAWQDRLDLAFHVGAPNQSDDTDASRLARSGRIRALRSAQFHGEVQTRHPRFDLNSEMQRIVIDEPTDDGDRAVLRRIDAAGDVHLRARPEHDDPLELEAETLAIDLDADAVGDVQPRRVVAAGAVRTSQPGQRLSAQRLELQFGERAAVEPAGDEASDVEAAETAAADDEPADVAMFDVDRRGAGLERMIATGEVHVELDDPATELTGHRLVADAAADQLELTGLEGEQAYVVRDDGVLAGEQIVMRRSDQTLHVDGAGWFDAQLAVDDPADQLRVNWQRAMHYDDRSGHARFLGRVRAATRDGATTARLTSDDLQLQLTEVDGASVDDGLTGNRRIQTASARGEAEFVAEQRDPTTGKLRTRMTMRGPLMSFDHASEQVQVVGQGRMLIEDRRPDEAAASDSPADDEADDEPLPGVQFSGRGDTLFEWSRQLTLDAADNTVLMEGDVQMVHRPRTAADAEPKIVQLDSETLFADLTGAGGLDQWAGGAASEVGGEPELRLVRADGSVRVLYDNGRNIVRSDHLQYTAEDQIVRLWADEGRLVRIQRHDQPTDFPFEEGFWNLETDAFDARRLGPGIVPITE